MVFLYLHFGWDIIIDRGSVLLYVNYCCDNVEVFLRAYSPLLCRGSSYYEFVSCTYGPSLPCMM